MRITPKDWREFQHYKDRNPPWIRLHKSLLDNYEFQCLPVASKALAPMLWLIASDFTDGVIDADIKKLAFRLRQSETEIAAALKPLIDNGFFVLEGDASDALADCKQSAVPETLQSITETEVSEEAKASSSSATPTVPCPYDDIVEAFHAALPMLPRCRLSTPARQRAMRSRWAWVLRTTKPGGERRATNAAEGLAWFRDYFARAAENDFITGRLKPGAGHEGWRCDIDFLLTDRGLKQVIEKTEVAA